MRLVGQHPLDPVALGVSGPGHFARAQKSGRFQVKADIKWQAELFGSVANDPQRTLAIRARNYAGTGALLSRAV